MPLSAIDIVILLISDFLLTSLFQIIFFFTLMIFLFNLSRSLTPVISDNTHPLLVQTDSTVIRDWHWGSWWTSCFLGGGLKRGAGSRFDFLLLKIQILTQKLHLPLPHALHLHGVEVRQVVVLVPQRVFLQAKGGQTSRSIPTRENAVRTLWGRRTNTHTHKNGEFESELGWR